MINLHVHIYSMRDYSIIIIPVYVRCLLHNDIIVLRVMYNTGVWSPGQPRAVCS
jgi:hypothetical protein